MASFIQGLTDQFSPLDLFKPDYSMLSQGVGTLENRLNQGRQQLASLYSSMLNAPLSTQSNQKFRDDYFKKVNDEFRRLSRTNLSKQSNVIKAEALLDPITNDEDLLTDIAKTRFYQNEFKRIDAIKNSTDPEVRKQYNAKHEEYVRQEYGRLTQAQRGDGSLNKIQSRKYTPFRDEMAFLTEAAKNENLKITWDTTRGMYKLTDVNGKETIQTYKQWAQARAGNQFDDQHRIESEVDTDNFISGKMRQGLSREQATREFVEQYKIPVQVDYDRFTGDLEHQISAAEGEIERLKREGHGKIHKSKVQEVAQLRSLIKETGKALDDARRNRPSLEADMQSRFDMVMNNPAAYLQQVYKNRATDSWAATHAMATAEHHIAEDAVQTMLEKERQQNARQARELASRAQLQARAQAFEAGQNQLKRKWDREDGEVDFKRKVQLATFEASLKGEGNGAGGGAGGGAMAGAESLVGSRTLVQANEVRLNDLDQRSSDSLHDTSALVVAAHLKRKGSMVQDTISPTQIAQLLDKSKQAAFHHQGGLTAQERAQLTQYLKRINPSNVYKDYYTTINMIREGIAKNATDPEFKDGYGVDARQKFYSGLKAMSEYSNSFLADQKHLAQLRSRGEEYAEKIGVNNGVYFIKDPTDPVASQWVRDPQLLKHYTQDSMQSVILTKPTEKTDPALISGLLSQATGVGQMQSGRFNRVDDAEALSAIRALQGIGTDNLSKVLDMQGARLTRMTDNNGKAYVQVEIGVKRNDKGESMATSEYVHNDDLRESMTKHNKITFQIGAENVSRILTPGRSISIPGGGQFTIPNHTSELLQDLTRTPDLNISSLSGLANLRPGGKYPLPSSFGAWGTKGYLTANRNGEVVAVLDVNGSRTEGSTGMHISDFQQHPDQAPRQLENAIEKMAQRSHLEISHKKDVARQRSHQSQQSHPNDFVDIDSIQ